MGKLESEWLWIYNDREEVEWLEVGGFELILFRVGSWRVLIERGLKNTQEGEEKEENVSWYGDRH